MFENIDSFKLASSLARHASDRQNVIAQNIANADTPGYRASDIADFASHFDKWDWAAHDTTNVDRPSPPWRDSMAQMHIATRPEFGNFGKEPTIFSRFDAPDETSPNGNTVALENQMVKSAAASSEHNMALALYRSSVDFLRTAIGK